MGGGTSKPAKPDVVLFSSKYDLGEVIGRGAFSEVRNCRRLSDGVLLAAKVINKSKLTQEDMGLLSNEIAILNSLDHPNIIHLIEFIDEASNLYIVTELVAGGELFDRIVRKEHYSEKDARHLVRVFLETMVYLHKRNIVHRDLKPENLLLLSDKNDTDIKIADFGLSKRVKDLTGNDPACGTPGYVAPEILQGKMYGTEVDIWAIGVIMYILIAGYPPFYNDDQKKLQADQKCAV
jgi:calcium/calmodulin-dependent protein kinase I